MTDQDRHALNARIAAGLKAAKLEKWAWQRTVILHKGGREHIPHDFTQWAHIKPALEAWCDKLLGWWTWQRVSMPLPDEGYSATIARLAGPTNAPMPQEWTAFGPTPEDALALAFDAALAGRDGAV